MKANEADLAKRFPLTLCEMLAPAESPMGSPLKSEGLQCGSGWHGLLEQLFVKLEAEIAAQPEHERDQYRAMQIKEKFGGLRVYLDGVGTAAMQQAIKEAEELAVRTCDVCSEPGQTRNRRGVIATRCEAHLATHIAG